MGYAVIAAMLLAIAVMVARKVRLMRKALGLADACLQEVLAGSQPAPEEITGLMGSSFVKTMAADAGEQFAMAHVIAMGMKAVRLGQRKSGSPAINKAVANGTFMILSGSTAHFPALYESYKRFHEAHGAEAGAALVSPERFKLLLERTASVKSIRQAGREPKSVR